jgi:hypothetical protein
VYWKIQISLNCQEYWSGLVHSETITVSLTPIGKYQELSAEVLERWTKVKVSNNLGEVKKYSYLIFGKEKMLIKILPNMKGLL